MNTLRLSLKRKWFEMTKAGIKTEDYREITDYWVNRFFKTKGSKEENIELADALKSQKGISWLNKILLNKLKNYDYNVMTLGYPSNADTSRILVYEHAGIEIRTGNPEWGAEPNKLYFVIKHGKLLN